MMLSSVSIRSRPTVSCRYVAHHAGARQLVLLSRPRLSFVERSVVTRRTRKGAKMVVEANLFGRVARVVRAFVSSFVGQFEDPERLLDRVTEEMQEDLIKMRQAAAKVKAGELQMKSKLDQTQGTADEWLRRAELAVRKGQDDLAREALRRRKAFEDTAVSLGKQLDAQRKATEQLTANVRVLETKLNESKYKRETLKARAAAARTSKDIQDMIGGLRLNNSSAWAAFDTMEERVVAMEAEAESAGLLATPDSLERQFQSLEGGMEDELSALKKGLITQPGSSFEGPGRRIQDVFVATEIDAELELLRKRARA